jgi:hypothetical protein
MDNSAGMQQFDAVLKLLSRGSAPVAILELAGVAIKKWLDAEGPSSRTLRADLMLTLAGLRNLEVFVEREQRKMPVYIDLAENKVLGPAYRKGREEGRQKGRQDGEIAILRRLIEARFGRLPAWAGKSLAAKSTAELEELSVRVLSASSIRELLK